MRGRIRIALCTPQGSGEVMHLHPIDFAAQVWELQKGMLYFMKIGGFVNPYSQNLKIAVFQGFTQNLPVALRPREEPLGRGFSGVGWCVQGRRLGQNIRHSRIPQGGADAQGSEQKGAGL